MSDKPNARWWGGWTLIRSFAHLLARLRWLLLIVSIVLWRYQMVNANMLNFTSCKWKLIFDDGWKCALKNRPYHTNACAFNTYTTHTHSFDFYCHAFFKLFSVTFTYANVVFIFIEIERTFWCFFLSLFLSVASFVRVLRSSIRTKNQNCTRHEWNDGIPNKMKKNPCVFHEFHSIKVKVFLYLLYRPPTTRPKLDQLNFKNAFFFFPLMKIVCFSPSLVTIENQFSDLTNGKCKALKLFWKWRSVETITLSINKISWNNFNYIFVHVPVCLVKNEFRTATGCPKTENMFFVWQQRTNRGKKKINSEQNAA